MTQWACEYRASEHARRALQNFLCGWCFNFQSVWVNNVWLSVPLLALTVSCLNLIAHRAWGSGWVARVWVWGFLYLHNGASQSLFCIGELWTKLIYQALWANENFQGCTEGSPEVTAAFPTHCTLRLCSHFLHTGIQVQLNKRERKLTGEKWWAHTISVDCDVYWVPFTQSCRRLGPSSLARHATVPDYCSRYGHFSGLTTTTRESQLGALSWRSLRQALSLSFVCISFRKVRWCRAGKFKLLRGQWAQEWVSDSKQFWGVQDNIWLSQRLMTMEKKFANIPSSFLQDLS